MKAKFKKVLALVLVAIMCCGLFSACDVEKEELIGTWSSSYVYDGDSFSVEFVLFKDDTYAKATYKNGRLSSSEIGTWDVDGSSVRLHENGDMGSTIYEYDDGKLVNNGHVFVWEKFVD